MTCLIDTFESVIHFIGIGIKIHILGTVFLLMLPIVFSKIAFKLSTKTGGNVIWIEFALYWLPKILFILLNAISNLFSEIYDARARHGAKRKAKED